MKITSVRIQNFRSFQDATVNLDDYTCLVGGNGAGKSTILTALNVFFHETANASTDMEKLDKEDFHNSDITQPIIITVTFEDLNEQAQEDFKNYYRQGKLIVTAKAEWGEDDACAIVKQYGERLGIAQFKNYFEMDKAGQKVEELRKLYKTFRTDFPDLEDVKTKGDMVTAMADYEAAHPEKCTLLQSEDQFYGVSRAKDRLEKYIQWVYIPAVKDASTEQIEAKNTALGKLLERRVYSQINLDEPIQKLKTEAENKYQELVDSNKPALDTLSESLKKKLRQWSHQNAGLSLNWQNTDKAINISKPTAEVKAIEGPFTGELARFGHGLQRSFIFALLQELAEYEQQGPKLILACEEPELYQHPPQARYLAILLQRLSRQNSQIIVCTHSPYFITGSSFENIRMVDKNAETSSASVTQTTFDEVADTVQKVLGERPTKAGDAAAKVEQDMQGQMNEMFFASVRILVEGVEDMAYISSYLSLMDKMEEFRSLGCHIIQVQGKSNLIYALAISERLKLPTFTIFDSDGDTPVNDPKGNRNKHQKDNSAIMQLCGIENPNAFPTDNQWENNLVVWKTKIGDIVKEEIGEINLTKFAEDIRAKQGITNGGMDKNIFFIGHLMSTAWEQDKKSSTLVKLCECILKYAQSIQTASQESKNNLSLEGEI